MGSPASPSTNWLTDSCTSWCRLTKVAAIEDVFFRIENFARASKKSFQQNCWAQTLSNSLSSNARASLVKEATTRTTVRSYRIIHNWSILTKNQCSTKRLLAIIWLKHKLRGHASEFDFSSRKRKHSEEEHLILSVFAFLMQLKWVNWSCLGQFYLQFLRSCRS